MIPIWLAMLKFYCEAEPTSSLQVNETKAGRACSTKLQLLEKRIKESLEAKKEMINGNGK